MAEQNDKLRKIYIKTIPTKQIYLFLTMIRLKLLEQFTASMIRTGSLYKSDSMHRARDVWKEFVIERYYIFDIIANMGF